MFEGIDCAAGRHLQHAVIGHAHDDEQHPVRPQLREWMIEANQDDNSPQNRLPKWPPGLMAVSTGLIELSCLYYACCVPSVIIPAVSPRRLPE